MQVKELPFFGGGDGQEYAHDSSGLAGQESTMSVN